MLAGSAGYLALPLDLVPDFIPVARQLDDALVVALVLGAVLRTSGPDRLRAYWPGPQSSLAVLLGLLGEARRAPHANPDLPFSHGR
jgi:uncharacterized membrane protein YkvA (DUF1232 family)